jgi:hypothetical protein
MDNRAESKKAFVLEAFNTLFNKRDYDAAETFWSPGYTRGPKATSTMTIPNSAEVNEISDANRIQSNCSK